MLVTTHAHYGDEDYFMLIACNNLAYLYLSTGQEQEALVLLEIVLNIRNNTMKRIISRP